MLRPDRTDVPSTVLTLLAVAVPVALLAVIGLTTPWTAAAVVTDPSGGLGADQVAAAQQLRARLLVPSLASTALAVSAAVALCATSTGRSLLHRATGVLRDREIARSGLVVLLVLAVVQLVRLPFGAWSELLLRDAGLSTRSWAGWARDRTVQAGLDTAVTVLVVIALVALVRAAPRWWPIVAAPGAAAFVVLASTAYPLVVEPAFNDFEPLPAGAFREQVLGLAGTAGVPVSDVLVQDASRRATTLNAYVSGIGPTRRVVVQDTLLEAMTEQEALAVVAHELGHVATADVVRGTATGALAAASVVLLLAAGLRLAPGARRRTAASGPDRVASPPAALLALLVVLVPVVVAPAESLLSRQVERQADAFAAGLVPGEDVQAAMRLLAVRNLADPSPNAVVHWWFGSHPTTAERVAAAAAS